MSNIINVKEERNVLSFVGEVFNVVANSTNFYLKFELDSEWDLNAVVTAIFNFDGRYEYVELDENRMCQIPPTNSSRIWFCLTTEPDEVSKLSSTILSLDVEESGETDLSNIEAYQNIHANLLGLVQNLLTGNNIKAKIADFANVAAVSQSQVSLTGDEEIAGEKNFIGTLKQNSNVVLDYSKVSNENLVINPNFTILTRGAGVFTRNGEDIYTADRWGLFKGNGKFAPSSHKVTGLDETQPTVFGQWIGEAERLYGKTITVGAEVNEVRYTKTIQLPETVEEDYINNIYECNDFVFRIYVHKQKKALGVQFLVVNGVSIKIYNVKLEVSPFETKFIDRPKAEEVELCHRYFQSISIYSLGYGLSEESLRFFVPTQIKLTRGIVSASFKTKPKIVKDGVLTELSEEISTKEQVDNGVILTVKTTGLTLNEVYHLVNGKVYIDGEFYLW